MPQAKSIIKNTFYYTGIKLWNGLPNNISKVFELPAKSVFREEVKQYEQIQMPRHQRFLDSAPSNFINIWNKEVKMPRENLEIISRSMLQIKSLDVSLHSPGLDSCWWYYILRYPYIFSSSILLANVAIIAVELREMSPNLTETVSETSFRHYHLFYVIPARIVRDAALFCSAAPSGS